MKAQKKRFNCVMAFLLSLCLMGCGNISMTEQSRQTPPQMQEDLETIQEGLDGFVGETAYEQNFVKPHIETNIYIDISGYDVQDKKIAYFTAEELNEDFFVYRAEDDALVYTGEMIQVSEDAITQKPVYKGDFSALTTPGEYYIQTAVIGRSYPFVIETSHDKKTLAKISKQFSNMSPEVYWKVDDRDKWKESLYGFLWLSMSGQIQETNVDDAMEKQYVQKAQWLLSWKEEADAKKEQFTIEESYLLATVFSQASNTIKDDIPLCASCLKAAQTAYNQGLKLTSESVSSNNIQVSCSKAMAAASLYQVTGNAGYHSVLKEECKKDRPFENKYEAYQDFLTSYYYMSTKGPVDMNLCEEMMSEFMAQCTQYLDACVSAAYGLTCEMKQNQDVEPEILMDATKLAIADYIIVSREYRMVSKQQLHYLLHDRKIEELDADEMAAVWMILSIINR